MPAPGEHKTVQSRILSYSQEIGWAYVPREEADRRRGFDPDGDGTTLPLFYSLAPNALLVPHEIMEKEFFSLAETEGIADIEELNKILDRAATLKNFLKGKTRMWEVAR